MTSTGIDVVIWGVTLGGRTFRPSDWSERLAGLTSAFGHDQKLAYSPLVRPVVIGGVRAVVVGHELEALEPRFHQFLLAFAKDNELVTTSGPDLRRAPHALQPPKAGARAEPKEPV
jgi:hypothetical protein